MEKGLKVTGGLGLMHWLSGVHGGGSEREG